MQLWQALEELIRTYQADPVDHGDLLSMLVRARDAETGAAMSATQVRDELVTMLVAGTETTGRLLSWLCYELGGNPEVEARLWDEIDTVLAGRPVTFDDLRELRYTQRLIKEVLRLHNPVWVSMRRTTVPVELGGVRIPANADLFYSPATLHRDPALYPEPLRLDPDRWLPERAGSLPEKGYIPFGNGRHKCLGDHFALTEAAIALTTICARWRLVPVPGHRLREVAWTTVHPKSLPMIAEPRGIPGPAAAADGAAAVRPAPLPARPAG